MLVLTRRCDGDPEERDIWIEVPPGDGCRIKVTLSGIDRNKVKIGVEAPKEVRIFRGELQGFGSQKKSGDFKAESVGDSS